MTYRPRPIRHGCIVLGVALVLLQCGGNANGQSSLRKLDVIRSQHGELQQTFSAELEAIAQAAEATGHAMEAKSIRDLARPFDAAKVYVDRLPTAALTEVPVNLPPTEREWRVRLRRAREEYARQLYLLSRSALHDGFSSHAYRLVREVVQADPDHTVARRLLGYVRSGDEWVTPFAAEMARERMVWHDRFGWLLRTHVDRYERGERYYRRWMPAAKEAEIRRDFNRAWEVRTENFLVKTNHSLEKGVEVAKKLEEFYEFFTQTFAAYFYSPEQLQRLFSEASARRGRPRRDPFVIHYYASRDEYNDRLKSKSEQIAITTGFYHYGDRVAYFYFDPNADDTVLYHEATHQFFYEISPTLRNVGRDENFWITEGLACYMESFRNEDGHLSVGDTDYIRFEAARYRYLMDEYYVPFQQFSAAGMIGFQTDPKIAWNYSQASGLAHFFMHYEGGRYRDALVEHLSQVYNFNPRRPRPAASLPELLNLTPADIDRQYGEYIKSNFGMQ